MNEASEALRLEPHFISAILDTVDALIVVLDPRGRIVYFNRACERASGYSCEEVIGRKLWALLLTPEERGPVRQVFEELRGRGLPNQFENFWVGKGCERRRIAWSNNVVPDGTGSVLWVIGTGIDIGKSMNRNRNLVAGRTGGVIYSNSNSIDCSTRC